MMDRKLGAHDRGYQVDLENGEIWFHQGSIGVDTVNKHVLDLTDSGVEDGDVDSTVLFHGFVEQCHLFGPGS
jgi:hypothetical protein